MTPEQDPLLGLATVGAAHGAASLASPSEDDDSGQAP
jgi:hypothetical protein